jgi:type I restriction enzyme, S subunit
VKFVRLGDIAELGSTSVSRDQTGSIRYVATGDVDRVSVRSSTLVEAGQRPSRANLLACENDVLLAKMAATTKVLLVTEELSGHVFSTGFARLRPNPHLVNSAYLAHWLRTSLFQDQKDLKSTGATQRAITDASLLELHFPLLPLDTQKAVVTTLDAIEELIEKGHQRLILAEELEHSLIDQIMVQENWGKKPIAELGTITTGKTPPTSREGMFNGGTPFITPGDLNSRREVIRTLTARGCEFSRIVKAGATMVCCIGATIGKVDMAQTDSAFNQQINAIEWGPLVEDLFGLAAMRFIKDEIISAGASTTLPLLPKSRFSKLEIPVPPMAIQNTFSEKYGVLRDFTELAYSALEQAISLLISTQAQFFGEIQS